MPTNTTEIIGQSQPLAILLVMRDFPYPTTDGSRVDMWNRALDLKAIGYSVDVIATFKEHPKPAELRVVQEKVDHLQIVRRKRGPRQMIASIPLQVESRKSLRSLQLRRAYDVLILESEHVGTILDNPQLKVRSKILRLQNKESDYFRQLRLATRSLWRKAFYLMEEKRFVRYTAKLIKLCDILWFVSSQELAKFRELDPQSAKHTLFVPPSVDLSHMSQQPLISNRVLFLGSLGLPNNEHAVTWLLEKVHPLLLGREGYLLQIAGNTMGAPLKDLRELISRTKKTEFIENPSCVDYLYSDSSVFVNPMLQGAGVKLKTIEAIRFGLPVVSTSIGVEGTGLLNEEHVLIADTSEAFAKAVGRLLDDRKFAARLVQRAQSYLRTSFDGQRIMRASIESLAGSRNPSISELLPTPRTGGAG